MLNEKLTEPQTANEAMSDQSLEVVDGLSVDHLLELSDEELETLDDEQLSRAHHQLFDRINELFQQESASETRQLIHSIHKLSSKIIAIRLEHQKRMLENKSEVDFFSWSEAQLDEKYTKLTAQLKEANQKATDALAQQPQNNPLFIDAKTEEAKIISSGYWQIYGTLMRLRMQALNKEVQDFKEDVAEIKRLIEEILAYYRSVDSQINIEAPSDKKYETGGVFDADGNNLGQVEEMEFEEVRELAIRLNSDAINQKIWPTESAMRIIYALKKFREKHKS